MKIGLDSRTKAILSAMEQGMRLRHGPDGFTLVDGLGQGRPSVPIEESTGMALLQTGFLRRLEPEEGHRERWVQSFLDGSDCDLYSLGQ